MFAFLNIHLFLRSLFFIFPRYFFVSIKINCFTWVVIYTQYNCYNSSIYFFYKASIIDPVEYVLFLFLRDPKCKSESEERNHQMEREPQVSKHLKIVEIKCQNVDFRVYVILRFLSTFVKQVNVITGYVCWCAFFDKKLQIYH